VKRSFFFTEHSLQEIDNDDLQIEDVMKVAEKGEVVKEYPEDKPFPSVLKLGRGASPNRVPIHVVCAEDDEKCIHIITVYRPDNKIWLEDFKTKRK
jgi:hypothetical protein